MKNPIVKKILIFIIIAILLVAGYELIFKKITVPVPALQTTSGLGVNQSAVSPTATVGSSGTVGNDFLTLLLSIQSIKLDDSILSSKSFSVLQDFNRPIPEDTNPGRVNPFAPIGADSQNTSVIQVSTSGPSSITATSTALNGTLMTGGQSVTRWFEYGTTTALGTMTTPKVQQNPGAFTETISGLQPNTQYYVKAGTSINGVVFSGNVVSWKTALKK